MLVISIFCRIVHRTATGRFVKMVDTRVHEQNLASAVAANQASHPPTSCELEAPTPLTTLKLHRFHEIDETNQCGPAVACCWPSMLTRRSLFERPSSRSPNAMMLERLERLSRRARPKWSTGCTSCMLTAGITQSGRYPKCCRTR